MFHLYYRSDHVLIAEKVKDTLTVDGKPIRQGHRKFLLIRVLKEWEECDNDIHCKGLFLIWSMAKAISNAHNIDMINDGFTSTQKNTKVMK